MARTITGNLATKVSTQLGTEPIIVLRIYWWLGVSSYKEYSDKSWQEAEDKIIRMSGLSSAIKLDASTETGSIVVELRDGDSSIRNLLKTTDIHKRTCLIYQTYADLEESEKVLLFTGEISTPFTWDEQSKTVSFNIVSRIEHTEIGFSPEQGQFSFIRKDAIGKAWPIVFGTCVRVPAVKLTEKIEGRNLTKYSLMTREELNDLADKANVYAEYYANKLKQDAQIDIEDPLDKQKELIKNLAEAASALNDALQKLVEYDTSQEDYLNFYVDSVIEIYDTERYIRDEKRLFNQYDAEWDAANRKLNKALAAEDAELIAKWTAIRTEAASDRLDAEAEIQGYEVLLVTMKAELAAQVDDLIKFNLTSFVVEDSTEFTQGSTIELIINNKRLRGSFQGSNNTFTISDSTLPTNENVAISTTRANDNPNQFWLEDATIMLKGQYCMLQGDDGIYRVLYVTEQNGTKCTFEPIIYIYNDTDEKYEPLLLGSGQTGAPTEIYQTSPTFLETWVVYLENQNEPDAVTGIENIPGADWTMEVDDAVTLYSKQVDLYVANLITSSSIKEVLAYRTINGVRKLRQIPSSYYAKYLSGVAFGDITPTLIKMYRPLKDYIDEGWEDEIYVTLQSSIGPNIANIINWLITYHSNMTFDSTSYTTIYNATLSYPANFALFERWNVMKLIEDIAWQSRCAVYVRNNVVYMTYLGTQPAVSQATITESNCTNLQIGISDTDDLLTKLTAKWSYDYSKEVNQIVLRNNTYRYGVIEKEFDFFIYNNKYLVEKSATFWLIKYSNTWKKIKFTSFLDMMKLEVFDMIKFDFDTEYFASEDVYGIIESVAYDSDNHTLNFEVWLPVRIGEETPYIFAWPGDIAGLGISYPTSADPYAGGASDPKGLSVASDSGSYFTYQSRANDLGGQYPTDSGDPSASSYQPAAGREEKNYTVAYAEREKVDEVKVLDIKGTKIIDPDTGRQAALDTLFKIVYGKSPESSMTEDAYIAIRSDGVYVGQYIHKPGSVVISEEVIGRLGLKYNEDRDQWNPDTDEKFLAKITGHTTLAANRWKYSWEEIVVTDDADESIILPRSGLVTDYYALNTVEVNNQAAGVQGNGVDHDGPSYPPGFSMQPCPTNAVVIMHTVRDGNGDQHYIFQYENCEDGTCE